MNVNLGPTLEKFVADLLRSGLYQNQSEILREGLRVLKEREARKRLELAALRCEISLGTAQAEREEFVDGEKVFAAIHRKNIQTSKLEESRALMIERHRPAFELWGRCQKMLEEAIPKGRDVTTPFSRALDLLFIQASKSHESMYVLCVRGLGEDAATILRRMLEIEFQVGYLCNDPQHREERGKKYLAWFWLQADGRIKDAASDQDKAWWQNMYAAHKHLILNNSGKPNKNWWGGGGIKKLATELGLDETYERDYRLLCQFAHCTAQGMLLEKHGNEIRVFSGGIVPILLAFGSRYMLGVTQRWNDYFALLDQSHFNALIDEARSLDPLQHVRKNG